MKLNYWLPAVLLLASLGCSKKNDADPVVDPITTPTPVAPIVDPVNWAPILVQTNANAIQFNYGAVTLVKGMSGLMTDLSASLIGSYSLHVYLKSTTGGYIHLPANSFAGVAYTYYQKSANPTSTMYVTRATGTGENYSGVIVVGVKLSYLQTVTPSINFNDYATVKAKLGF